MVRLVRLTRHFIYAKGQGHMNAQSNSYDRKIHSSSGLLSKNAICSSQRLENCCIYASMGTVYVESDCVETGQQSGAW